MALNIQSDEEWAAVQRLLHDMRHGKAQVPLASAGSAAGSALADVEAVLKLVKDSYIHDNKHRLGALGCADMDMVEEYLACARGKLLNAALCHSKQPQTGVFKAP